MSKEATSPPAPSTVPVVYTVEDHHKLKTPIRWEGKGRTQKHVPPMFGQLFVKKLKKIYIFPGRIAWTDLNESDEQAQKLAAICNLRRGFSILCHMKTSLSSKAITFDILDETDITKVADRHVILFETEGSAKKFLGVLNQEITALQFQRLFSSKTLCEEVNAKIKNRINKGETGLRDLYLSCDHPAGIHPTIEVIFSNLRNMNAVSTIDSALANSFVTLLAGISSDPIIFILFHCFKLNRILISDFSNYFQHKKLEECISTLYSFDDALRGGSRNNSLLSNLGTSLVNKELERAEGKLPNVFIEFIEYLTDKVKDPKWNHQRHFLLALFQYPLAPSTTAASTATTPSSTVPPPPGSPMGSPQTTRERISGSSAPGGNRERSVSIGKDGGRDSGGRESMGRERSSSSASIDFTHLEIKSLDFKKLTEFTNKLTGSSATANAVQTESDRPDIEYASVASNAVITWAKQFMSNSFSKLEINFDMLLRMLDADSMYLYYILIKYYADYCTVNSVGNTNSSNSIISSMSNTANGNKNNVRYMTMAMNAFIHLPVEYLYSRFQVSPNSPSKTWFFDFLFHANVHSAVLPDLNVNEETGLPQPGGVFKSMLNAFQMSSSRNSSGHLQYYSTGYNRTFFDLFLAESFQRKNYKLAINVIMTVFFPPPFEDLDEEALSVCPEIAQVIFSTLANAMNNNSLVIMDETRLLLEIAIRFEYYAYALASTRKSTPVNVRDLKTVGSVIYVPEGRMPVSGSGNTKSSPSAAQQAANEANYEAKKLKHAQNKQNFMSLLQTLSFSKYVGLVVQYYIHHGEQQQRFNFEDVTAAPPAPLEKVGRRTSVSGKFVLGTRKFDGSSVSSPQHPAVAMNASRGRSVSEGVDDLEIVEDVLPRGPVNTSETAATVDIVSWKMRNSQQIVCLVYGYLTLLLDLYPIATNDNNPEMSELFDRLPSKFYPFFNSAEDSRLSLSDTTSESLKRSVVFFSIKKFNIPALYYEMLYTYPHMYVQESHFNYDMIKALLYAPVHISQAQCKLIVTTALQLGESDHMLERLTSADKLLENAHSHLDIFTKGITKKAGDKTQPPIDLDENGSSKLSKAGEILNDVLNCAVKVSKKVATLDSTQSVEFLEKVNAIIANDVIVLWKHSIDGMC